MRTNLRSTALLIVFLALVGLPGAALAQRSGSYVRTDLVSDATAVAAARHDSFLVNAWGIAAGPTSFWWVADNATGMSTLYDGKGVKQSLEVRVPGAPTGIVFNGGSSFLMRMGSASAPARFLFASEDGTISGWSPQVQTADGPRSPGQARLSGPSPGSFGSVVSVTPAGVLVPAPPGLRAASADGPSAPAAACVEQQAFVVFDAKDGAIYKGLALASTTSGDRLYATDFHNAKVDVIDEDFELLSLPGAFHDPSVPSGFAPFGIHAIGERIFVTYAKQDDKSVDDVPGHGLGAVSVFDTDGNLLDQVQGHGVFNAPWGIALAPPSGFGPFSGDVLVGNFGDGKVHAFDPVTLSPRGVLRDADRKPIQVDGLWGIAFGNGGNAGVMTALFFAAGPDDEAHGLFGRIEAQ